jgi:hypothetical protein
MSDGFVQRTMQQAQPINITQADPAVIEVVSVPALPTPWPVIAGLTAAALVAFAANSLLCRLALGAGLIDCGAAVLIGVGMAVVRGHDDR